MANCEVSLSSLGSVSEGLSALGKILSHSQPFDAAIPRWEMLNDLANGTTFGSGWSASRVRIAGPPLIACPNNTSKALPKT